MNENTFTFVVSDESVNKYGTRVLNAGINLEEFRKNPVLFWNHKRDEETMFGSSNKNHYPIGRWENLRIEEGKMIADAVLDLNDTTGKKVAQKIQDGFIKAASIGIAVTGVSDSEEFLLKGQTRPTITQSQLLEISIVDIPANGNAMRLSYEGEILRLDDKESEEKLNKMLPIMENKTEQKTSVDAAEVATNAVQKFWAKIKETFNLSPKEEGTTTDQAETIVKEAFVQLKADFEGFEKPETVDNTELINELKASNDQLKASFEEMKEELIQLKGKKGGSTPNDEAPMSQKKTPVALSAHEKSLQSAGNFFNKKLNKR